MEPKLAAIALGSNMGDSLKTLKEAARDLANLGQIMARSSLYLTDPVGGPEGQDAFLNAVILLEATHNLQHPESLLEALLSIEKKHGRERRVRWGPRTLDLDLIFLGDEVFKSPTLTLPHPRMLERAFVLAPLCEVWPELALPESEQKICDSLNTLDLSGIKKTDLSW